MRHRDEPRTLARLFGTFEGYVASLLVNSAGLVVLVTMAIEDGLPVVLTVLLAGWWLLNIAISATVFVVVARPRIRQSAAWAELDFVEQHALKYGRPPETIEDSSSRSRYQRNDRTPWT
ncbi:hypothetical protein JK364_51970 [Streptomyces sp. 110]|uniref:Uncharacterized protein n=1 Tax=Streptomyces endocoffeicus TaxID=2898945 RepID=A0ABS1Q7S9_9ACTN|nr:hypothetical protein [Streptomyces endocoffeicus]MBL1120724.1 hypothetical protein [Streptomyces endocoffeicus]